MVKVNINAELLRWARERAGMTVGELSAKFPKLDQWEQGEAKPTLKQVEDYAKTTQTPFGYMFLERPPSEPLSIPDFRTMNGRQVTRPSPNLLEMIYACEQRQDWFRGYVRSNDWSELPFVGRRVSSYLSPHSCGQPLNIVATRMRFDDAVTFRVESDGPNRRPVACVA